MEGVEMKPLGLDRRGVGPEYPASTKSVSDPDEKDGSSPSSGSAPKRAGSAAARTNWRQMAVALYSQKDTLLDRSGLRCLRRLPVFKPGEMGVWDFVILCSMAFVAVVTPYEVALIDGTPAFSALFALNRAIDVVFVLDIFVNFNLAFENRDTNHSVAALRFRPNESRWETRRARIAERYVRSWLLIDVISVFPFEFVAGGGIVRAVRTVRLLRLLKMLRVLRSSRIVRRWNVYLLRYNLLILSFLKLILIMLIVTHWGACFWIIVARHGSRSSEINWIEASGLSGVRGWDLYARAIHWSSMTLVAVGYGDICMPSNTQEYVASALYMLFCGGIWTYIIGSASAMSALRNELEMEFILLLTDLNRFLNAHSFDESIKQAMREYFLKDKRLREEQGWLELMPRMSPGMKRHVSTIANGHMLRSVPALAKLSPKFLEELAMRLRFAMFPPGERVTRPDEDALHALGFDQPNTPGVFDGPTRRATLVFVVEGLVVLNSGERYVKKGEFWGEDMMLTSLWLRRTVEARAVTYVEVATLQRGHLDMLLSDTRHTNDRRALRAATIRTAFRRAVFHKARWLRERAECKDKDERKGQGYEIEIKGDTMVTNRQKSTMEERIAPSSTSRVKQGLDTVTATERDGPPQDNIVHLMREPTAPLVAGVSSSSGRVDRFSRRRHRHLSGHHHERSSLIRSASVDGKVVNALGGDNTRTDRLIPGGRDAHHVSTGQSSATTTRFPTQSSVVEIKETSESTVSGDEKRTVTAEDADYTAFCRRQSLSQSAGLGRTVSALDRGLITRTRKVGPVLRSTGIKYKGPVKAKGRAASGASGGGVDFASSATVFTSRSSSSGPRRHRPSNSAFGRRSDARERHPWETIAETAASGDVVTVEAPASWAHVPQTPRSSSGMRVTRGDSEPLDEVEGKRLEDDRLGNQQSVVLRALVSDATQASVLDEDKHVCTGGSK